MKIMSYVSRGFDGRMVTVEADLRRGIPGIEIVGLPDVAVREARERIRAALRNSGYSVPKERILINLAPAGVKKEGASFDLPIAAAILIASGQVQLPESLGGGEFDSLLVVGELELSGRVRPVDGVLAAVASARSAGVGHALVPKENLGEAETVGEGKSYGISSLSELTLLSADLLHGLNRLGLKRGVGRPSSTAATKAVLRETRFSPDISDIQGQPALKRAVEIAAAGRHHLLLFGPPGVGKTMAGRRLEPLLPDLSTEEAMEVTRIHSIAGFLENGEGLITRPPLRSPHHTASREGLIGGADGRPGEISLSHRGVLFLDEALEFRKTILQSLREPIERGEVEVARAGVHYRYPSRFQLVLAANPCPCGKLGQPEALCMCSPLEIHRYWKKLGAALMDRVDMRLAVGPVPYGSPRIFPVDEEGSSEVSERVALAALLQKERYAPIGLHRNADLGSEEVSRFIRLSPRASELLSKASTTLGLSSRASQSILKIARSIADLAGEEEVGKESIAEAVEFRRYGDGDYYWRAA